MVRRLALVAVLAVTLAGCSALAPGDAGPTPADTVTPMPVQTDTPATTPTPPPGIAPNGSVSPGALTRAHLAALDGRSFRWRLNYSRTVRPSGDGTADATVDIAERRLRVDEDGSYLLTRRMTGTTGGAVYADDTGRYVRSSLANGSGYRVGGGDPDHRHYLRTGQTLGRYFPVDGASVSTVERDGRTYYRLHVTAPPSTITDGHAKQRITDYTATAYVTTGGLVRAVVVEYEYALRGDEVAVSLRSAYRGVGETDVSRPDWVAPPGGTATATASVPTTSASSATATEGGSER
ncbi:DUF7537 family lipoprotein [Halosimplex halophilum]|uniref:DUF7537 family lipoprotein n=1 Tax=Halosimplex halophilum TaxID=2559572 RepID=UPI00107F9271|nr:hypothetical protein [Halosimplex halophilum]